MTDVRAFLHAALPWIIMGICVAILAANRKKPSKKDQEAKDTYATEGMCLGMLVGLAIGQTLKKG